MTTPASPKSPSPIPSPTSPTHGTPTHSLAQGWLVAVKERAYGPYPLDQLSGFIAPSSWVFHPVIADWSIAADVGALQDVLAARADQEPEWWFQLKGHREQGPYSRLAMLRMVKDHAITRDTVIRHISWTVALPILETPLAESLDGEDPLRQFHHPRFTKHEVAFAKKEPFSWRVDARNVPSWFIASSVVVGFLFFGTLTWWSTTQKPSEIAAYRNADRIVPEMAEITLQAGSSEPRSIRIEKTDHAGRQIQNDATPIQGGLVPVIDGRPALPGTPHSGAQPNGRLVQFPANFRDGIAEIIIAPGSTRSEDVLVITQPGVAPTMVRVIYE